MLSSYKHVLLIFSETIYSYPCSPCWNNLNFFQKANHLPSLNFSSGLKCPYPFPTYGLTNSPYQHCGQLTSYNQSNPFKFPYSQPPKPLIMLSVPSQVILMPTNPPNLISTSMHKWSGSLPTCNIHPTFIPSPRLCGWGQDCHGGSNREDWALGKEAFSGPAGNTVQLNIQPHIDI